MSVVYGVVGIALVLFVVFDVLKTTLARGGGVVSNWFGHIVWLFFVHRSEQQGSRSFRVVQGGLFILLMVITAWIALLWTGWTMAFHGSPEAVLKGGTMVPATTPERIYFAGYTHFTLGIGDFVPGNDLARIGTALASLTGLFIITFSITYLVPVLQAAVHRRHVGAVISCIGKTPCDIILTTASNTGDFSALEQHLTPLMSDFNMLAQRHATYPVLHYFHGARREEALAPAIAVLDEALSILEQGFREKPISDAVYVPVRKSIDELLRTLASNGPSRFDEPPPAPPLRRLQDAGLPVREQEAFEAALKPLEERRLLLLEMVAGEGWSWEDVEEPVDDE